MKGYTVVKLPGREENIDRFGVKSSKKELVAEMYITHEEASWSISFLYVREDLRRKGIGTMMLQEVLTPIAESGMFIPVEMTFMGEAAENGLLAFMEAQPNFTVDTENVFYRIPAKLRRKSEEWKKLKGKESSAEEFYSLPAKMRNAFMNHLAEEGYEDFIDPDEKIYDKHLCFAKVQDDAIIGAIFVRVHSEEELELSFLYTDGKHPKVVAEILGAAIEAADELYPAAEVWFSAITPESAGMADGMFGDMIEPENVYTAFWNGWSEEDYEDMNKSIAELKQA